MAMPIQWQLCTCDIYSYLNAAIVDNLKVQSKLTLLNINTQENDQIIITNTFSSKNLSVASRYKGKGSALGIRPVVGSRPSRFFDRM